MRLLKRLALPSTYPWLVGLILVATVQLDARAQENSADLSEAVIKRFGSPPAVPSGPLSDELIAALDATFAENLHEGRWRTEQNEGLQLIADSGDPRLAWILTDMMRIAAGSGLMPTLVAVVNQLLQKDVGAGDDWRVATDHLIAWKIPEPPGYLKYKRFIFTLIEPKWNNLFIEGNIDWRHVSWGGVRIDDRAFDDTDRPCNCIPAADLPDVTDVAGADWLKDEDIVFGIVINGEARAYPRQIMEVREMVNDQLGGRQLGIPYCTLCGAAQAYYTDEVPEDISRPVLRTSGLLIRSNKVMYDINSYSIFDTFKGTAVTGPLAEKGIQLNQASVVTATWGEWKEAHPDTTVLAERLALGRNFDFRNNRDANGPIFPVGDVDPRLPVHEDILGAITASGKPIAFQVSAAIQALQRGETIQYENIKLTLDAGGLRAIDADGKDLGSHQAFWFAWSQFYPETALWTM